MEVFAWKSYITHFFTLFFTIWGTSSKLAREKHPSDGVDFKHLARRFGLGCLVWSITTTKGYFGPTEYDKPPSVCI
jgi:hypothetical protein